MMTVFITGATGYIGGGVARAFLRRKDRVIGLSRRSDKAEGLGHAGIEPVVGSLADGAVLEETAARSDVVVHAAADSGADAHALDEAAVTAVLRGLGEGGRLLYTSGTWVFGDTGTGVADEETARNAIAEVWWRPLVEDRVMAGGGTVIRPGVVYGGESGMTAEWFGAIRAGRPVEVVGDGRNIWPMVHVDDLAAAYVLAAEHAPPGRSYNIVDDSRDTWLDLLHRIGEREGRPPVVRHLDWETAQSRLGVMAEALSITQRVSNHRAKTELGWKPEHGGLGR
jgi:nucleoside-diphosphate-sugar epimerase